MQKAIRAIVMSYVLVVFPAQEAAPQDQAAADVKEIAAYRLTVAALKKFEVVVDAMADWARKDPEVQASIKLQAQIDTLRAKEEMTESDQAKLEKLERQLEEMEDASDTETETLSEMADEIARIPGAAAAFRRAGMTPREYLVFSFALFQASAYAQMKQGGHITAIPKEANLENVKFAETHAAQLKAIQEKAERIGKQLGTKGSPQRE